MAVKQAKGISSVIDPEAIEALESDEQWQKLNKKEVREDFNDLQKLRFKDIDWRLKNRENFRKFLMILLVGQNIAVFALVSAALWFDKMIGLQMVFSTLIGATLAETAATILIIVRWLFSEIHYEERS